MLRVLILGATTLAVLSMIVTVSPILEGSIEAEPLAAAVAAIAPQQFREAESLPTITSSCVISTHPSIVSRGEEASIAWGSENAVLAVLSGVGEVPLRSGLFVKPLVTGDHVLSVVSETGEWSFCATTITVR